MTKSRTSYDNTKCASSGIDRSLAKVIVDFLV
jgi:hypothetical protein